MKNVVKSLVVLVILVVLAVGVATILQASVRLYDVLFGNIYNIAEQKAISVELDIQADLEYVESMIASAEAELEAYKQQLVTEAVEELSNGIYIQGLETARNNAVGQGKMRIEEIINQRKQENMAVIEQAILEYLSN
jgi:hypothetical protein